MTTFIQLFLVLTAIILTAASIAEKEQNQTGNLTFSFIMVVIGLVSITICESL